MHPEIIHTYTHIMTENVKKLIEAAVKGIQEKKGHSVNIVDMEGMEGINELEAAEIPEELRADYEAYNTALEGKRNIGMAKRAKEFLKNGDNLFYMVGFAHFCGEGSVIDLLEKDGYTVERLH